MAQEKEVVFRRIKGRIVPIRVNKKHGAIKRTKAKKKSKQRAAGIFGLGTGLISGFFGGKLTRKAETAAMKAGRAAGRASTLAFKIERKGLAGEQLDLFKREATMLKSASFKRRAIRLRKTAVALERFSGKGRLATLAIGGSLIGAGVENIIDSSNAAKEGALKELGKDFGVNLASSAVAAAFVVGSTGKIKPKQAISIIKEAFKRKKQMKFKGI